MSFHFCWLVWEKYSDLLISMLTVVHLFVAATCLHWFNALFLCSMLFLSSTNFFCCRGLQTTSILCPNSTISSINSFSNRRLKVCAAADWVVASAWVGAAAAATNDEVGRLDHKAFCYATLLGWADSFFNFLPSFPFSTSSNRALMIAQRLAFSSRSVAMSASMASRKLRIVVMLCCMASVVWLAALADLAIVRLRDSKFWIILSQHKSTALSSLDLAMQRSDQIRNKLLEVASLLFISKYANLSLSNLLH